MKRRILYSAMGAIIGASVGFASSSLLEMAIDGVQANGSIVVGCAVVWFFCGYFAEFNTLELTGERLIRLLVLPLDFLGLGLHFLIGFICLPVVLMVIAPIIMYRERKFRQKMSIQNRTIESDELIRKLEKGEGTILEDFGSHTHSFVWWTADDVTAKGTPISSNREAADILNQKYCHLFNEQCLREYLDEETGKAQLTSLKQRKIRSGSFARKNPAATVVRIVNDRHSHHIKHEEIHRRHREYQI